MPDQNPQPNQGASPFEIVTPGKSKKGGSKGLIIAIVIIGFLLLSVVAGVLLVRQQQNIQEKASGTQCPGAEQCPNTKDPTLLQSCHPGESDGTTDDSICNQAGRIQTCGPASTQYCCPKAGGTWTTNMSACSATPSPSPSPSPTVAPTPSPSVSPTGTPIPTLSTTVAPQATPLSVPVTGVEWPTVLGVGIGAAAIVISILIAL